VLVVINLLVGLGTLVFVPAVIVVEVLGDKVIVEVKVVIVVLDVVVKVEVVILVLFVVVPITNGVVFEDKVVVAVNQAEKRFY